jgi:hypothetical protein
MDPTSTTAGAPANWHVITSSVIGASHERKGKPNQDAIEACQPEERDLPLMAVVSDGHGSAAYFRSDVGARLAAEVVIDVLRGFVREHSETNELRTIKAVAESRLPPTIERKWRDAVDRHLEEAPIGDEQQGAVVPLGVDRRYQPYGATVLGALVEGRYLLLLKLGDGDILLVDRDGNVVEPFQPDDRLIANETTSLCQTNAQRSMSVGFQVLAGNPPSLILLSTDGYANSFATHDDFRQVGRDLARLIRDDGLETVSAALEGWLKDATKRGSGDDVSVAILANMGALETAQSPDEAETPAG